MYHVIFYQIKQFAQFSNVLNKPGPSHYRLPAAWLMWLEGTLNRPLTSSLLASVQAPGWSSHRTVGSTPLTSAVLENQSNIWPFFFFLGIFSIWNFLPFSQDQLSLLPTPVTPGICPLSLRLCPCFKLFAPHSSRCLSCPQSNKL